MKKINPLLIIAIILIITAAVIIGTFFAVNLYVLPQIAKPKIQKMAYDATGQKLEIKSISLSPKGTVHINKAILLKKNDTVVFADIDKITIFPDYKTILKTWMRNKNQFTTPFDVSIKQARINQDPVIIETDLNCKASIDLDLKNPENIDYKAALTVPGLNIYNIPVLGDIKNITGVIDIKKDQVKTAGLQGMTNDAPVKLNFTLDSFTEPSIALGLSLTPLTLNLECAQEKDILTISKLNASYNNITLDAAGNISDIKKNPECEFNLKTSIDLSELEKLPLEIKPMLQKLNPKGTVKAELNIKGPIKEIDKLNADAVIKCDELKIMEYIIADIVADSTVKEGQFQLSELNAIFNGIELGSFGKINLMSKTLPFDLDLKANGIDLEKLQPVLEHSAKIKNKLNGMINLQTLVSGNAKDLEKINIQINSTLNNIAVDNIVLPKEIEADADLTLKDLKQAIIIKLNVRDNVSTISINGRIDDFVKLSSTLTGNIKTDLAGLRSYKPLNIPSSISLKGNAEIDFETKGPLIDPEKTDADFKIKIKDPGYNQYIFDDLSIKGSLNKMNIDIKSLLLRAYSGMLELNANLDMAKNSSQDFSLNAQISDLSLQRFAESTGLIANNIKGTANAQISAKGKGLSLDNLDLDSQISMSLANAYINNIPIEQAKAEIGLKLKDKNLFIDNAGLAYKDINAKVRGKVMDITAVKNADLNISSSLKLEDLNKMPLPADIKTKLDNLGLKGLVNLDIRLQGPLSIFNQLIIDAKINSDQIEAKKIIVTNVDFKTSLIDKVLNSSLNLDAYDGKISTQAKADLIEMSNFIYRLNANADNVNIGKLITESKIIPGNHQGIASLTADLNGAGTKLETLEGTLNFKLKDTVIEGMGLLKTLASVLKADFLSRFEITQGNADIIFEKGKAALENTSFEGPKAIIQATGNILLSSLGFENFFATLLLTPEGAAQIPRDFLDSVFNQEQGYYKRKIEVKGTLSAPEIDRDKILRDVGKNLILKKVLDKNKGSSYPEGRQKNIKEQVIEGLLNSIFK